MKIFKKRRKKTVRPAKAELQSIIADYKRRTAEITDGMAMDMLDNDKKNDFLLLLKIADYAHMGKSRAILTAFKLGYLERQTECEKCEYGQDFQSLVSEVSLKLQKAAAALRAAMENYSIDKINPTQDEMIAIGYNAANICDMLSIVGDYIYEAKEEMEGGILE